MIVVLGVLANFAPCVYTVLLPLLDCMSSFVLTLLVGSSNRVGNLVDGLHALALADDWQVPISTKQHELKLGKQKQHELKLGKQHVLVTWSLGRLFKTSRQHSQEFLR
eukprot:5076285-Amphidinium_carterae.1